MWWSLIAVIVGLLANTLTIIVFSSMKKVSSNVYLMVLGASDLSFIVTFVFYDTLAKLRCMYFPATAIDIVNRSDFMCIALQYLLDLFSDFSAMLILAFTVDRYIACYYPMRYNDLCTVLKSKITSFAMLFTIAITIAPYHIACMGQPFFQGAIQQVCVIIPEQPYEDIFFYCYVLEVMLYRVIPIIIIGVCNVFIILKVREFHRARKERRNKTLSNQKTAENGTSRQQKHDENQHIQLTIMLIMVSTTYIVLYLPVLVTFFVSKFFYGETITAIKYYTTALDVVGFAINFFLYTVSGKEFRTQLLRIVCGNDKTSGGYSRGKVCFCVKREHPDADKGQFMRIDNGRTVEAASMETHL